MSRPDALLSLPEVDRLRKALQYSIFKGQGNDSDGLRQIALMLAPLISTAAPPVVQSKAKLVAAGFDRLLTSEGPTGNTMQSRRALELSLSQLCTAIEAFYAIPAPDKGGRL